MYVGVDEQVKPFTVYLTWLTHAVRIDPVEQAKVTAGSLRVLVVTATGQVISWP